MLLKYSTICKLEMYGFNLDNQRVLSVGKSGSFSAEFKAKVAISALKEQGTINVLVHLCEVIAIIISKWKQNFLLNNSKIFKEPVPKKKMKERTRFRNLMLR